MTPRNQPQDPTRRFILSPLLHRRRRGNLYCQLAQLCLCLVSGLVCYRPINNSCSAALGQGRWVGGWRGRLRVARGGTLLIAGLGFQGLVKPGLR